MPSKQSEKAAYSPLSSGSTSSPSGVVRSGFDPNRLRKLQLQRAAFSKPDAVGDRESSSYSATNYQRYDNDPAVYVLPDFTRDQKEKSPWELPEKPDYPIETKYRHGLPRWGPRLVSVSKEQNDEQVDGHYEESVADSNTTKSCKFQQAEEKAKLQSTLAAKRAMEKIKKAQTKKQEENNSKITAGIRSRLFRRNKKPSSLLQSARTSQTKVIVASTKLEQAHQSVSLDGATIQYDNKKQQTGTQSHQDFEYFQENEDGDSIDSEETSSSGSGDGVDEDSSLASSAEDIDKSWSAESSDSSADTHESSGASQQQYNPPSLWQRATTRLHFRQQPNNPSVNTASSVPTLAPSEEDHSRHSDQSSLLFVDTYDNLPVKEASDTSSAEETDMFYDPASALYASPSEEQRAFDARRCQQLLYTMHEKQIERGVEKKLLSHGAARKLLQTPPLLHVADERAIRELATRGKWLYSKQQRLANASKALDLKPKLNLASMRDEEVAEVKPFELRTPNAATPLSIRKELWHKPTSSEEEKEREKEYASEEKCILQLGGLTLAFKKSPKKAEPSYFSIMRNFIRRWTPFFLALLWMQRSLVVLGDILLRPSSANEAVWVRSLREPSARNVRPSHHDLALSVNNSLFPAPSGITQVSSSDMRVLKPKSMNQNDQLTDISSPSSSFSQDIVQQSWGRLLLSQKSAMPQFFSSFNDARFLSDITIGQTFVDDNFALCFTSLEYSSPIFSEEDFDITCHLEEPESEIQQEEPVETTTIDEESKKGRFSLPKWLVQVGEKVLEQRQKRREIRDQNLKIFQI